MTVPVAGVARDTQHQAIDPGARAEQSVLRFVGRPHYTTRGPVIRALQKVLNLFGAKLSTDSIYGPNTENSAREFLASDLPDLARGDGFNNKIEHRAAVRRLQRALNVLGANLTVDGRFGENTENALIAWQQSLGADNPSPEGQVTRATWNALFGAAVDKLSDGAMLPTREQQLTPSLPPRRPSPRPAARVSDALAAPPRTPASNSVGVNTRASGLDDNSNGTVTLSTRSAELPAATADFDPEHAYQTLLPQLEAVTSPAEQNNLREGLHRYVTAYANFTRANPGVVTGQHGLFVNFGARNDSAGRGFILDMQNLSLTRGPMTVSHGHGKHSVGHTLTGTGFSRDYGSSSAPFSNTPETEKSSLGVYTTFPLSGQHRGEYARVGLDGHSIGFNDNARSRGIYMHGVPNAGYRTQGCPGFTNADNEAVQRYLEGQTSFVFLDAPVSSWHRHDRWVNGQEPVGPPRPGAPAGVWDVRDLGHQVGLRNNNPWNVKTAGWSGETGHDDRGHAQFDNAAYAARAAAMQLIKYYTGTSNAAGRRELKTLRQIFNTYAPADDTVGSIAGGQGNQPNVYADWVARQMGISSTQDIQLVENGEIDPQVAVPLLDAIARYENYSSLRLPDGLIQAGLDLL